MSSISIISKITFERWDVYGTGDMGLENRNQDFGFAAECDCRQVITSHCNVFCNEGPGLCPSLWV